MSQINNNQLLKAAEILTNGGVIAHATETVYGLAARFDNLDALNKVAELKQRNPEQPYSILVSSIDEIIELCGWESKRLHDVLDYIFPAPLTVLLPRKKEQSVSFWNSFPLLGFRYPNDELCYQLCKLSGGPLISTSANLTGERPPLSANEIPQSIRSGVDLLLDSGECKIGTPSTIIKCDELLEKYTLIRNGAYPTQRLDLFFQHMMQNN